MTDASDEVAMVSRLLVEQGPMSTGDVVAQLRAAAISEPDAVVRRVLDEMGSPTGHLIDGRWVWLPTLMMGRVFTHRVTADELAHDLHAAHPDLNAITHLCDYEQHETLADGSPVSVVLDYYDDDVLDERGIPEGIADEGALLLPAGTLEALALAAGDVVGVRLSQAGLVVERVTDIDSSTDIGSTLTAVLDPAEPTSIDSAVWTVCATSPTLFTHPLPPVGEIIANSGVARDRHTIAAAGFDIEQWRFDLQCDMLAKRYDIEPADAVALRHLVVLHNRIADALDDDGLAASDSSRHREPVTEFGSALSDPLLAELLLDETLGHGSHPAALALFAETLEPQVSRSAKPAYRWLRAAALEQLGDVVDAEREYLAAESMDTEFWPTLLDLARFASDRGDAERGLALLHRAGADADHPMVQQLQMHRATPRTDVGRNDACWCGSGRKYKKCHLGNEQLPLEKRAGWLYQKSCQHVVNTAWSDVLAEVAEARGMYGDPDAPELLDPLLMSAVLCEGGAFPDFLAKRGPLLPDDERLLAEQWLLVDRSVFDVEQVHRGRAVTVRDVRTGDVREVSERIASGQLKPGQLICTLVLPVGDEFQFFGGVEPVALHHRNPLIELLDSEPDPVELVEFLSRRFAPPTLVNTEGDSLVMCETTLRVDDAARTVVQLDGAFDRTDDGLVWLDHVTTHGMARIAATLSLDGATLTVRTNSEERMERVLETLTALDPSSTVVDENRTSINDARDAARMSPTATSVVSEDDPAVAVALDKYIRQYETAWLDDDIPALEGYTPRQAADDPTRRGDLIKLLDSFPTTAGGMNADRLRAALGL